MEPNNTNDNQNGIETTQQLTRINADNSQPKEALSEEQPSESIFVQPEKSAEAQISDFASEPEIEPSNPTQEQPIIKKERKLIKLLRIIVWLLVAIFLPIGAVLRDSAEKSISYANGTYQAKQEIGDLIFTISIIVFALNFIWGTVRWILRLKRKKCSIGRIIGKLIGGGIWRATVFTPIVLFSLLFLSSFAIDKVSEMSLVEREQTSSEKISAAYANNEISADEYVSYTLSAAFDIESLPDKFKSQTIDYVSPDLTSFMDAHFDELSDETLVKFYEIYAMPNVRFGTDSSGNARINQNRSLFAENAYALSKYNIVTLNKAKLSSEEHFIVYYTDTGESKISDSEVQQACDDLERIVGEYKEKFGINFEYTGSIIGMPDGQDDVLRANNVAIDAARAAMPVYVMYTNSSDSDPNSTRGGTYYGASFGTFLARIASLAVTIYAKADGRDNDLEDSLFRQSIPSYPMINLPPGVISGRKPGDGTEIDLAHELGHHYQGILCGENCNFNKFVGEGTANLFAINVNRGLPADNHYSEMNNIDLYLPNVNKSIDSTNQNAEMSGYASTLFFENLYESTNEDVSKIKEYLQTGPANVLAQIKNITGDTEYKQAMINLSERNILDNYYPGLPIANGTTPAGDIMPCTDICALHSSTNYSSSNYIYFTKHDYLNRAIQYTALDGNDVGSLLGQKKDKSWNVIYSGKESFERYITEDDEYIAFAVVNTNYSADTNGTFDIRVTTDALKDIIVSEFNETIDVNRRIADGSANGEKNVVWQTLHDESLISSGMIIDLGMGCYQIKSLTKLLEVMNEGQKEISLALIDLIEAIDARDYENDYSDIVTQIRKESAENDRSIVDTITKLGEYDYVICENYIKPGLDFDMVKSRLKIAYNDYFELLDITDDGGRGAVFGGIDILGRSASIRILIEENNEIVLYSLMSIKN